MTRDTLYLLPPGFVDNDRREYCPECAEIWGVLSYYPAIKESVDILYQPIDRTAINALDDASTNSGSTVPISNIS